ncbi:hypothetical protein Q8F55_000044 [Vanrija albida]|uniref:F-box domain-containing protein n=1 Tax=Vanrija albida TaxID=181172 RepID=A0ABR3QC46_9TREE
MAPTLDHTAYPYIIDEIIAFAPLASLLQLRGTSQSFRARINALLFDHAELRISNRHPRVRALHVPKGRKFAGACIPWIPSLVHTLDVDVRTTRDRGAKNGPLPFTALRSIRRFGLPKGNGTPRLTLPDMPGTVVDYIDLSEQGPYQSVRFEGAGERQIVHLCWNELVRTSKHYAVLPGKAWPAELVFVLWPVARPADDVPGGSSVVPDQPLFMGIFQSVAGIFFRGAWGTVQCTVVGLEHIHPHNVPLLGDPAPAPPRPDLAAGVAAFRAGFTRTVGVFPGHAESAREVAADVRCVTREEWWAELGEEKELVGKWPADS